MCADALAALGSRLRDLLKRTIPIHKIDKPSIELPPSEVIVVAPITKAIPMDEDPAAEQIEATDSRTEFINYLVDGKLPAEKWIAR